MSANFLYSTKDTCKRPIFNKILKFASAEDVLHALKNPDEWIVIDTRTLDEYEGRKCLLIEEGYGRGRIKGSLYIDWFDFVDENYSITSARLVDDVFSPLIENKKVILYCHSGIRSGHLQSVLIENLGYSEVYNYDESWVEWSFLASRISKDDIDDEEFKREILEHTENWSDLQDYKRHIDIMPNFHNKI